MVCWRKVLSATVQEEKCAGNIQRVSALSIMQQSPEGHINTKSCNQLEDRLKERTEDISATVHWSIKCSQRTLWVREHLQACKFL
jgi:hypothetical protein